MFNRKKKAEAGGLESRFRRQEAAREVAARRYHGWSLVLITAMVREYEQKLLASDLPVEDGESAFWKERS